MNDYNIIKHYCDKGEKLEDIILNYFNIYLDFNKDNYE